MNDSTFTGLLGMAAQFAGRKPKSPAGNALLATELDLCATSLRRWTGTEFRAGFQPFFMSQALNFAIIAKHVVDQATIADLQPYQLGTRLLIPCDVQSTVVSRGAGRRIAGLSFYIRQRNYQTILDHHFFMGLTPPQQAHDMALLDLLASIPSFDPFIVRDRLVTEGRSANPDYLGLDERAWSSVRNVIFSGLLPVLTHVFKGAAAPRRQIAQAAEHLLGGMGVEGLEPLCTALEIDDARGPAILYAWKGILYYRHRYRLAARRVNDVIGGLSDLVRHGRLGRQNVRNYNWPQIIKRLEVMGSELDFIMQRYDMLEADFCTGRQLVREFMGFFAVAESLFWLVGGNLACFEQVGGALGEFNKTPSPEQDQIDDFYRRLSTIASYANR